MRRIMSSMVVVAGLGATLLVPATPVGADTVANSYSRWFEDSITTATVDQVRVNRQGGITVNGSLDCTAEVADAYTWDPATPDVANIPADTTVFVNVNWVAFQFVGRNKVIRASYDSGIAHPCFNNNAAVAPVAGPWSWSTKYAYPVGTEQWVYSGDGKFGPGAIHIEMEVVGSPFDVVTVVEWDDAVNHYVDTYTDTYAFYSFSGWDVKAVKAR